MRKIKGGEKHEGIDASVLHTAAMWVRHRLFGELFPQNAIAASSMCVSPQGKISPRPRSTYPPVPAFEEQRHKLIQTDSVVLMDG